MSGEAPKRTKGIFVLAVRLELARAPNWPGALAPVVREATPPACTLNLHINTYMLRFGCVEAVGGQGGTVAGKARAGLDVLGVLTTGSVRRCPVPNASTPMSEWQHPLHTRSTCS